jgi:hypothetical protein
VAARHGSDPLREPSPAAIAALRSVGLSARSPVSATRVMALGPLGGFDAVIAAKSGLLEDLRSRTAGHLVSITFSERVLSQRLTRGRTCVEVTATAVPVMSGPGATPGPVFRTTLGGPDVVALLLGGWKPVDVIVVGTRQHSQHAIGDQMASRFGLNAELPDVTQMISDARRVVRDHLATEATALGADGTLLDGDIQTTWSKDRVSVNATATANAVARVAANGAISARRTMPLDDMDRSSREA